MLKKTKIIVSSVLLSGVLVMAGSYAYLTDKSDTLENTFKTSSSNLTIHDNILGSDTMGLTPLSKVKKSPVVENIDKSPSYVTLSVTVPYLNVAVASDDGKSFTKEEQPIYSFDTASVDNYTWEKIGENISSDEITYTYVYGKLEDNVFKKVALAGGETTKCPLFNEIQLKNIIEGEIPSNKVLGVSLELN